MTISNRLEAIEITNPGIYTSIPNMVLSGPGSGAAFTKRMTVDSVGYDDSQSGLGSYAPGDTITPAGGTYSEPMVFDVAYTQVVTITIVGAGTGGTPGTQTITGTTGTGTKFEAEVTVSGGGVMTSIDSITEPGIYSVNPTDIFFENVTGGGLVGAQVAVRMGVQSIGFNDTGIYTVLPTNPMVQGSTSGTGTGATFSATAWGLVDPIMTDHGLGYTTDSILTISGGGETLAAEFELVLVAEDNYPIDSLNIDRPVSWINTDGYRGVIGVLPNIPNEDGSADEIVTTPVSIDNLPDDYSVVVTADQADVFITVSDKTTSGFNINLKPLSGGSIAEGFLDALVVGSK